MRRANYSHAAARHSATWRQDDAPAVSDLGRSTQSGTSRGRLEGTSQRDQPVGGPARSGSRRSVPSRRPTARIQARQTARTGGQKKSRRGFAAMSAEQQLEIARKGGLTVSRNRKHMANIGRLGGEHSHRDRRPKARNRR
jgi:uncharacterized protein